VRVCVRRLIAGADTRRRELKAGVDREAQIRDGLKQQGDAGFGRSTTLAPTKKTARVLAGPPKPGRCCAEQVRLRGRLLGIGRRGPGVSKWAARAGEAGAAEDGCCASGRGGLSIAETRSQRRVGKGLAGEGEGARRQAQGLAAGGPGWQWRLRNGAMLGALGRWDAGTLAAPRHVGTPRTALGGF
jgi:hypothetical protein